MSIRQSLRCLDSRIRPAAFGFIAVAALNLLAGAPANAAGPSESLIERGEIRVTMADYDAAMAKLPPEARAQFSADFQRIVQILDNLQLNRAISADARAEGLDRDPVLSLQIAHQTERILSQAYIERLDAKTGEAFDKDPERYNARAREIYLTQPDQYRLPERVRVSRVLISPRPGESDAATRARAVALREKAVAGEDFAELARTFSDEPPARETGGDLGFIAAKGVDPVFAKAAFALKSPGELSPIVKTQAGYEIIRFQERKPAEMPAFDQVRPEILAEIRKSIIEDTRNTYQRSKFTAPPPTYNEALLAKINAEARTVAKPISGDPRAAPR
jgi:peptidyl-prolyl cis-trans isomerase C